MHTKCTLINLFIEFHQQKCKSGRFSLAFTSFYAIMQLMAEDVAM